MSDALPELSSAERQERSDRLGVVIQRARADALRTAGESFGHLAEEMMRPVRLMMAIATRQETDPDRSKQ